MKPQGSGASIQSLLVGALLVLDLALAHWLSRRPEVSVWGVLLAVAPVSVIGLLALRQFLGRLAALIGLIALAVTLALLFDTLQYHISWIYFLQHLTVNLALGIWFGRTLKHGRQPLCTTFAGMLHPVMHDQLRRYTHRLTQVWSGFFFGMALTSTLLFALAPVSVWSTFANLLTLPLVVAVFVIEYAVRYFVLPPQDRLGVTSAFRAYRQTLQQQAAAKRRTADDTDRPT